MLPERSQKACQEGGWLCGSGQMLCTTSGHGPKLCALGWRATLDHPCPDQPILQVRTHWVGLSPEQLEKTLLRGPKGLPDVRLGARGCTGVSGCHDHKQPDGRCKARASRQATAQPAAPLPLPSARAGSQKCCRVGRPSQQSRPARPCLQPQSPARCEGPATAELPHRMPPPARCSAGTPALRTRPPCKDVRGSSADEVQIGCGHSSNRNAPMTAAGALRSASHSPARRPQEAAGQPCTAQPPGMPEADLKDSPRLTYRPSPLSSMESICGRRPAYGGQ